VIIGNPPYLRSQNQDDLDSAYKGRLFASAKSLGIAAAGKTDLFLFFIYHGNAARREAKH
jgi:methylase of polypeptide subunit release factors